jgi:protein-S-isoprenylcysteine O-methyltransferase Ste14
MRLEICLPNLRHRPDFHLFHRCTLTKGGTIMNKMLVALYGFVSYLIFFLTFLYSVGFVGGFLAPKNIDSGEAGAVVMAIVVNLVLMSVFALQHSIMARPAFKQWWTQYVPAPIERSTYVLFSSVALILLFWLWQPMPAMVWQVENTATRDVIWALFWLGWAIVLVSTFLINHFELFGLRQVYLYMKGVPHTPTGFRTPFLYQLVRHPIMLGFIIAFWATPDMSQGHMLFSVVTTAYILIAVTWLEERDLVRFHGAEYVEYQRRVSMIFPMPKRK